MQLKLVGDSLAKTVNPSFWFVFVLKRIVGHIGLFLFGYFSSEKDSGLMV